MVRSYAVKAKMATVFDSTLMERDQLAALEHCAVSSKHDIIDVKTHTLRKARSPNLWALADVRKKAIFLFLLVDSFAGVCNFSKRYCNKEVEYKGYNEKIYHAYWAKLVA